MTPSLFETIKAERRRSTRVTPDPLLTIFLPSGNHGIVLDVSHDGVGFLASSPVEEAAAIRFEIGARSARRSAGSGQLMWKDEVGKRGGLRFADVSEELRALLTQLLPMETMRTSKASHKKNQGVHPSVSKKSETNAERERRILGSDDIPDMPDFGRKAAAASAAVYPVDTRGRRFYANAITIGMACAVAGTIWYGLYSPKGRSEALNFYSRVKQPVSAFVYAQIDRLKNGWTPQAPAGQSVQVSSPSPAVKTVAVAAASLPSPVQVSPSVAQAPLKTEPNPAPSAAILAPVAEKPVAEKPDAEKKDARPDLQLLSSAAPRSPQPSPSEVASPTKETKQDLGSTQPQLAAAQKLLQDDPDNSNASKAAQLLWQAVEKGNSAASIDLADLYLTGRGVAKNCNQAIVLLTAAKNHKSALAESKLQGLDQYGCEASADPATDHQAAPESDSANLTR